MDRIKANVKGFAVIPLILFILSRCCSCCFFNVSPQPTHLSFLFSGGSVALLYFALGLLIRSASGSGRRGILTLRVERPALYRDTKDSSPDGSE